MWQISVCCVWPRIRLFWLNAASSATGPKEAKLVMLSIANCSRIKSLKQLSNNVTDLACIAHPPKTSCNPPAKALAWCRPLFVASKILEQGYRDHRSRLQRAIAVAGIDDAGFLLDPD